MDTSWCPVCNRLIPPNREQVLVEVPVEDSNAADPINPSNSTIPGGNNNPSQPPVNRGSNPTTTTNKSKGTKPRTNVAAVGRTRKGQRKDVPTVALPPPPPPPPAPEKPTTMFKQRTILTQEPSLYCSERCRLEDLHSQTVQGAGFFYVGDDGQSWGEGSSFTATTSTSSSAIGYSTTATTTSTTTSRSKSPRMGNGRRGSNIVFDSPGEVPMGDGSEYFNADKANVDYFESLRYGRKYFTTATTTTVPPSRSMSGDIYAVVEDDHTLSTGTTQALQRPSYTSRSRTSLNTLALHAMAPVSRTTTQSSIHPPPPSPTHVSSASVPHTFVHALYGGAYPLAFERSKSSGAIGRAWRELQKKEALAAERERLRKEESSEGTTVSEGSSNGKGRPRHRHNHHGGRKMGIRRHSKPMKSRFDGLEPEFEGPLLADDELCAGADAEGTPGSPTSPAPHSYPSPKQLSMSLPIASHLSPQSQSRSRSRTHGISITGAGAKPLHSTSKRSSFAYGTPSLLLKVALPFHSNSQAQSLSCSPSRHSHSHSRQFSAPINGLGKRTAEAVLSTVNAISSSVPQTSYFPSTSQHHPSHLSNPPTDSMATAMPLSSSKTRPSHSRVNSAELTMNINVMGPTTIPGGAIAYLKKTSTESYVPTYPLNPIPVRPGEKRKQLFHFARG